MTVLATPAAPPPAAPRSGTGRPTSPTGSGDFDATLASVATDSDRDGRSDDRLDQEAGVRPDHRPAPSTGRPGSSHEDRAARPRGRHDGADRHAERARSASTPANGTDAGDQSGADVGDGLVDVAGAAALASLAAAVTGASSATAGAPSAVADTGAASGSAGAVPTGAGAALDVPGATTATATTVAGGAVPTGVGLGADPTTGRRAALGSGASGPTSAVPATLTPMGGLPGLAAAPVPDGVPGNTSADATSDPSATAGVPGTLAGGTTAPGGASVTSTSPVGVDSVGRSRLGRSATGTGAGTGASRSGSVETRTSEAITDGVGIAGRATDASSTGASVTGPATTGTATSGTATTGPLPSAAAASGAITAPPSTATERPAVRMASADAAPSLPTRTAGPAPAGPARTTTGPAAVDQRAPDAAPSLPFAVPAVAPGAGPAGPAVSATAAAPSPTPAPLAQQLARPLFTLAAAPHGEHVVTVTVSPETLGSVTVRAHVSADGMRVELFAASDAGRDAVRSIMPELRRDLGQTGVATTLDLSGQNQPSDTGGGDRRPSTAPRPASGGPVGPTGATAASADAAAAAGRTATPTTGLDVLA
ncbi:flagellar hook-length control protein FliK [Curtobacterium sp. MCBD17_035]|uniref:flagellar hook-length control protein FliK n=1 Tax=Curtobacterium sp. MCBD17_035 TaxID=2175673 RepID=UPI000DAA4245|nr:flagellar hook-length control protein FliK [Curtobacterium sp. MCBD17_035]WIB68872.1 flagellar hook-length control protein FliK [Curtobacterium sp. MCBD17_035]